jgi:predicted nucleotidyltransferase component of viral defense system
VKSQAPRDMAASVRQRLLNLAKERGEDFNFILLRYGLERLLFRLGESRHAGSFVLKGAMLFPLWSGSPHRATKDMDLLGDGPPQVDRLVDIFREIAAIPATDGVVFLPETVRGGLIREEAVYDGIRVMLQGRLGVARLALQVDIGFGDAVTPVPTEAAYPVLLADTPVPHLRVYARETAIAEKVEAMVQLGMANSRMKDFFDVWFLARNFEFDQGILRAAIRATFERRRTPLPNEMPLALTTTFATDAGKATQWRAFVAKARIVEAPPDLGEVIRVAAEFLEPVLLTSEDAREGPAVTWRIDGGWRSEPR